MHLNWSRITERYPEAARLQDIFYFASGRLVSPDGGCSVKKAGHGFDTPSAARFYFVSAWCYSYFAFAFCLKQRRRSDGASIFFDEIRPARTKLY
jgi:hypothetical protein